MGIPCREGVYSVGIGRRSALNKISRAECLAKLINVSDGYIERALMHSSPELIKQRRALMLYILLINSLELKSLWKLQFNVDIDERNFGIQSDFPTGRLSNCNIGRSGFEADCATYTRSPLEDADRKNR